MCVYRKKPNGGTEVVGTANLIDGGRTVISSAHVFKQEICNVKIDLSKYFLLDTGNGKQKNRYFFDENQMEFGDDCDTDFYNSQYDWIRLKLKKTIKGVKPYRTDFQTELSVGDSIEMISAAADNFGNIKDRRRIVQNCHIILRDESYYGADCDSGNASSGSIILNSSGVAIGFHKGGYHLYGEFDYEPADDDNYSIISRVKFSEGVHASKD